MEEAELAREVSDCGFTSSWVGLKAIAAGRERSRSSLPCSYLCQSTPPVHWLWCWSGLSVNYCNLLIQEKRKTVVVFILDLFSVGLIWFTDGGGLMCTLSMPDIWVPWWGCFVVEKLLLHFFVSAICKDTLAPASEVASELLNSEAPRVVPLVLYHFFLSWNEKSFNNSQFLSLIPKYGWMALHIVVVLLCCSCYYKLVSFINVVL